ncbi:hypothetical protein J3F83DRAFT_745719 [Trichoderma novae-zelandiae]
MLLVLFLLQVPKAKADPCRTERTGRTRRLWAKPFVACMSVGSLSGPGGEKRKEGEKKKSRQLQGPGKGYLIRNGGTEGRRSETIQ